MRLNGPTFEEMLHPETVDPSTRSRAAAARTSDPLDPVNLFNIHWRADDGEPCHLVLPHELTGVEPEIVVITSAHFPTGSHKVGAAYAVLAEDILMGRLDPARHRVVWPSTGNYGVGGAWVGGRVGVRSTVILPEGMSAERFRLIASYGADIVRTPGSESNVREIYDAAKRLARDPDVRVLNQFEVMGNYRFHYHVTGNTVVELAERLERRGVGDGRVAAFVSAMGSAGTIAAGDRLKWVWPETRVVGLEPIQCPTLFKNGYGAHDIQGIGDKHVTWIHNVLNMDALMAIDDMESKKGLQLLTEEAGWNALAGRFGVPPESVGRMAGVFGISGVCNVLGAIRTAKHFRLGPRDLIVTVCTDDVGRYRSVLAEMTRTLGPMGEAEAAARVDIFRDQRTDWVLEGTPDTRERWHNLKYYTWVEQQGKTVEELDAQRDPGWWGRHQEIVPELDALLRAQRA